MQAPQDSWYVQVNGQNYGPYNAMQMQAFCSEGRVNEHSIISQSATQGYAPATRFQSFLQWTGRLEAKEHPLRLTQSIPQTQQAQVSQQTQVLRPISAPQAGVLARQMTPNHAPQNVAPSPVPAHQVATPVQQPMSVQHPTPVQNSNSIAMTVFIVMAEIRSANGMDFLQALQDHGTAQRIGDSLWLLQSATSVEQLRNVLSQTLTKDDRLFLLDSFANKTAWFNIGTNMDARIRELWDIRR